MLKLSTRFLKDETGATAIEYGLLAGLIAISMIVGANAIAERVNFLFADTDSQLVEAFD